VATLLPLMESVPVPPAPCRVLISSDCPQNGGTLPRMSIWDASLHTANRWFDISWYGLLGAGCIAALAALATVAFLLLQFWSSAIREKHVALDIAGAAKEAALANEGAAKANERAASLEKESEMLRGENLALQNIMRPRRLPIGGGFSDKYEELAKFAGTPVVIFVVADLASQVFAGDIWNVLKKANRKLTNAARA
jgi:hypothetical protein